jgi:hypothetical protein
MRTNDEKTHEDLATRGQTPGDPESSRTASKNGAGPFIVAEISKNWIDGRPVNGDPRVLAELFERVIDVNRLRGYRLYAFQLHRVMVREGDDLHAPDLNETIIAVFEKAAP